MRRIHKRTAALLLVAAMAAGTALTGCGRKDVDYSLDNDSTDGDGGLASKLGIPESYSGTLEGIDAGTGLSEVKIDASQITVPDSDSMSVTYYVGNDGGNEYKKRVCESFFDVDAGIYFYDWEHPYRGDIEREIEIWKTRANEVDSDSELEYYDSYIASLEEELKNASDERQGAGDYSESVFVGSVGSDMYMVSFMTEDDGTISGFSIDYFPTDSLLDYKSVDGASSVYRYSGEYVDSEDSANKSSISEDEAVQVGLEFLTACGITDVTATDVYDLIWDYSDEQYNTIMTEKDGYSITYRRSVDGIAPYSPYVYSIDLLMGDGDVWYDTEDELFELYVDDSGVTYAYCYDYYKASGDKEENVSLITWDEALEALPKAINTYYADNENGYDSISFNDVRLAYYKLGDDGRVKYAPVWVFAQCEASETGDTLDVDNPVQLVMLNAMTGELIDLRNELSSQDMDDLLSSTYIAEPEIEDIDETEEELQTDTDAPETAEVSE